METKKKYQGLYTVLMLAVSFIWGYGFIVTVKAMDAGYSTGFILMVRFSIAALVLGIFSRTQLNSFRRIDVSRGMLCGLLLFLGFALQTFALPLTTPSNSALLTVTSVIFIPILVWIVFKKKPTKLIMIGGIMCFVGIIILSVDPRDLSAFGAGDFLTLLCAISFALNSVLLSYFAVTTSVEVLNFFQMVTAALLSTALFFVTDGSINQFVPRADLLWVLYLAIFSTTIAYFVQTKALLHLSAEKVGIISATESVIAAVFSLIYGYDKLNLALIIGGGLVFLSIIIVEKPAKKQKITG